MTIEQERDIAVRALKEVASTTGDPASARTCDDALDAIAAQASPVAQDEQAAFSEWFGNFPEDATNEFLSHAHFAQEAFSGGAAWQAGRASVAVPAALYDELLNIAANRASGLAYYHGCKAEVCKEIADSIRMIRVTDAGLITAHTDESAAQPVGECAECSKKESDGFALYCVECLREFFRHDPTAQLVGEAVAYVSASEFAKLADNRVAGIGMMLSKEPADGRIALYTDPASTKPPSTGLQIAIAAHDLLRAAEACGQVLTIHLEPRLPLAMGNYVMTYEVRPVLVRP